MKCRPLALVLSVSAAVDDDDAVDRRFVPDYLAFSKLARYPRRAARLLSTPRLQRPRIKHGPNVPLVDEDSADRARGSIC